VFNSLTANIGHYKHCNTFFISSFEGRMFSRWIVTNITSARETVHCLKTRIPCGDQLVICGLQKPCRKICEVSLCVVWELVSDERYVAVIQLGKSFLVTHPSPAVSYDFSRGGGLPSELTRCLTYCWDGVRLSL
jgi:hypothetical protein